MSINNFNYQAFGLNIQSEIPLPELIEGGGSPDVCISYDDVPECLENPTITKPRFQVKPGQLLLKVDNVGSYIAENGNSVKIKKEDMSTSEEVRLFLLGSVFGALFHQRDMLPLHASAVAVGGECVLFCAHSGNGKSTTAHELTRRGYTLHADDICVIKLDENNKPVVYPGFPQMKLWEDILKRHGQDTSDLKKIRPVLNKFAVPVRKQFNKDPLPIRKIYILHPNNESEIEFNSINGLKKFNNLKNHTYRFNFVKGLEKEPSHFKLAAAIGNQIPLIRVSRPRHPFMLSELVDALEKDFLS